MCTFVEYIYPGTLFCPFLKIDDLPAMAYLMFQVEGLQPHQSHPVVVYSQAQAGTPGQLEAHWDWTTSHSTWPSVRAESSELQIITNNINKRYRLHNL